MLQLRAAATCALLTMSSFMTASVYSSGSEPFVHMHACMQAQEALMAVAWPAELLEHESGSMIRVGDLLSDNPTASGVGGVILAGLRVRMGINTGAAVGL